MPTKREREYYQLGFRDGADYMRESPASTREIDVVMKRSRGADMYPHAMSIPKKKRKLNSWQKFVKANSKKRKFRFKDGKLKLKSMGIAYRKTAAYKRSKK